MNRRRLATRLVGPACMLALLLMSSGCDNANRSMVFFTGTTLGVEIAFEPNSTAPAKFIVGYKRAEGLLDPIMDDRADSTSADRRYTIRDNPHSVLAKIAGEINTGTGATSPGLQGAQWFASGEAAEILARHPATAAVLTNNPEVAKEAAKLASFGSEPGGLSWVADVVVLKTVYDALLTRADGGDVKARQHVRSLDNLGAMVPDEYVRYSWTVPAPSPPQLTTTGEPIEADQAMWGREFAIILTYYGALREGVDALSDENLERAFSYRPAAAANESAADDALKLTLKDVRRSLDDSMSDVENVLREDEAVIRAVQYYFTLLLN